MPTHNFPIQLTSFVGRAEELIEIAALLRDPDCRLLTLVGPGGIGKTRLALEVAARLESCAEGVYFVALQSLSSPDHIVSAIASAINFQVSPGGDPKQQLLNYLREKDLLLVLDNFEHLLIGVDIVNDLLASSPHIKILDTSRERLNLSSETIFPVSGMHFPETENPENVLDYSAVKLFVQTARRVRPDLTLAAEEFKVLARLCRVVGGMPLAILLAASWVEVLSLKEILTEIEHSLDLLETEMRDLPQRHRSIRAAFDVSWKRLSESERTVFKKLSIFRGGFTREAAQAVAGASLKNLLSLVNKSLVQAEANGRYDLHELLRQYAEEQLNASIEENNETRNLHCAYYTEFMRQQRRDIQGSRMQEAFGAIDIELENVQTAWLFAAQHGKFKELTPPMFMLQIFYFFRNRFRDGERIFAQAIAHLEALDAQEGTDEVLGYILACYLHNGFGGRLTEKREAIYQKSISLLYRPDNPLMSREAAMALCLLGDAIHEFYPQEARRLSQQGMAICRTNNYRYELMLALVGMTNIDLFHKGDHVGAKPMVEEGLTLAHLLGNPWFTAAFQSQLGLVAYGEGDYLQASRLMEEAIIMFDSFNDRLSTSCPLLTLGDIARVQGNYREARQHYLQGLSDFRNIYLWNRMPMFLAAIAELLAAEDQFEPAVELSAFIFHRTDDMQFNPKGRAAYLLGKLEAELPSKRFEMALEHGKALDLEKTVEALLLNWSPEREKTMSSLSQATHDLLPDALTARELEILRHVAAGLSNQEIAERLVFAVGTVKWYVNQIYSKLHVTRRAQAIIRAQELDLLS